VNLASCVDSAGIARDDTLGGYEGPPLRPAGVVCRDAIVPSVLTLSGHAINEERSLRLHRRVAERLSQDLSLLTAAKAQLQRWQAEGTLAIAYIEAWRALIDGPLPKLLAILTGDSETSRDLRQTTPFAGVLNPRERWALLRRQAPP